MEITILPSNLYYRSIYFLCLYYCVFFTLEFITQVSHPDRANEPLVQQGFRALEKSKYPLFLVD